MWRDNLKKLVEISGKTQECIALEANLNQGTLSNIINGRRVGTISTLESIAKALDVSLSDLFQDNESLEPNKIQLKKVNIQNEILALKAEMIELIEGADHKNIRELQSLLPILKKVLR